MRQRIASPSTFASRLSSLGRTRHQGAKELRVSEVPRCLGGWHGVTRVSRHAVI